MTWAAKRRWGSVLGLWLLLPWLTPARAGAAELNFRGPDSCPDADEMRFRIERAIGTPLRRAAPLVFAVAVARAAQGYSARITIEGSTGSARQRALVAADCSRLADLVAVAVALALGAGGSDEEGQPGASGASPAELDWALGAAAPAALEPSSSGRSGSTGESASSEAHAQAHPDSDRSSGVPAPAAWWPAFSLWFLADTGSLPHVGTGLAAGVQLQSEHFQLSALGSLLFVQHQALQGSAEPAPGANLGLFTGALSACAAPWGSFGARLAAEGCLGWELGRLSGEGTNVLRPRSGAALWSAPRAEAGLSWALTSSLRLGAGLTFAFPILRDDFVLNDLGLVHRPPAVVGRAAIGVGWALR
jgi:hypothetical protein